MDSGAIVTALMTYRYWIIFPVAVIEGPILSFIIGTLAGLGYFNPFLAYPILLAGDLIPDTILYYLGRKGKRAQLIARYASKIGITGDHFEVIENIWQKHPRKTIVMSKLALGLSTPLLVTAGMAGIRAGTFFSMVIPVTMLQHAVLLTLGYHFGGAYSLVKSYIGNAEFFVIVVAVFAVAYYLFSSYMKKKFLQEEKAEEKNEGL